MPPKKAARPKPGKRLRMVWGNTDDFDPTSPAAQELERDREAYLNQRSVIDNEPYLTPDERRVFDEVNRLLDAALDTEAGMLQAAALAAATARQKRKKPDWRRMLLDYAARDPSAAVMNELLDELKAWLLDGLKAWLKGMPPRKRRGPRATSLPLAKADVPRIEKLFRVPQLQRLMDELEVAPSRSLAIKIAALRWEIRMFDNSGMRIARPNPSPTEALAYFKKRGARKKVPTRD